MFSSISIEFNNDRIKLVEGVKKGNSLSVLNCLSIELPKNSIEDGKINNLNIVKKLLRKSLEDNAIKTKKASFIINSNLAISRKIELPYLKSKKDTKSMINYNLKDMFSANLNQYIFIYKITDVFIKEGVKHASYIIQGLPKTIYEEYLEIAKSLKLELKKLDISSNCLESLTVNQININNKQFISENVNAFISINNDSLNFSILNRGTNEFFRNYYFNENEEKIERVAEELGAYATIHAKANTEYNQNQTFIYTDVILKYLKYYYSISKGKEEISKIFVYGDNIYPDIEKEQKSNLDIDVELISDISNINADVSIQNNFQISSYLNCTLALLENKASSNFLTESQMFHKLKFNAALILMSLLLIFILTLAFKGINYLYRTSIIENELQVMKMFVEDEDNIDQNIKIEESKLQIEKLKTYLEQAILTSNKIKIEDCVNSELLIGINASVPDGTRISSVSIDKNNIFLFCKSSDMTEISIFLNNLRNSEFIKDVYVPEVEINNEGEKFSYLYEVLCNTVVIK